MTTFNGLPLSKKNKSSHMILFNPSGDTTEPLDLKEVRDVLYSGICPVQWRKYSRNGDADEEWRLRLKCLQDWFLRCSWTNKFLFLEILCNSTRGCLVLEKILKTVGLIYSKDVFESLARYTTDFDYDRIPADDNRAMEHKYLMRRMKNDFFWFVNLDATAQSKVILRLLRLGGGGLVLNFYKTTKKIYEERRSVLKLLANVPSRKVARPPDESPNTTGSDSSMTLLSARTLNLSQKRINQLVRRDEELKTYKEYRKISEEDKSTKKREPLESLDYMQMLPISLNRKIMSYVDAKALPGLRKVGKYWGKMIDESINEKTGRKAINGKINKIIEIKPEGRSEGSSRGEKAEDEEIEFIAQFQDKKLLGRKIEAEITEADSSKLYEHIFSKKFSLVELEAFYHPERCCAFDKVIKTLACSSPNNSVHFYSIRTGDKLRFTIFNLESSVTSLALHEDRTHVFIGCRNGTLISRNMRTNMNKGSFSGHSKAVISIFATESNLLSSSRDNTIKFYQLWSGLCLLCVDMNSDFNISCALLRSDKPSWSAIGTTEGVLILVDLETKQFLSKVKLHKEEITQVTHLGDILITGSRDGKIRVWDMTNLDENLTILNPFYDINVGSPVRSLTMHKNQIFTGCDDGTLKIISLTTGEVTKLMKISCQAPILGSAVTEDRIHVKIIIWHEREIEVRTFARLKTPVRMKKPVKSHATHWEPVKRNVRNLRTNHVLSEMVFASFASFAKDAQSAIFTHVKSSKATTFSNAKIPLKERCCTLPALRKRQPNAREFKTDVFTEMLNSEVSMLFPLKTFPRYKNFISNKK